MVNDAWSIDSARQKLEIFRQELEKIAPDPSMQRILDIEKEYSTSELRSLLQQFGGYLASLHTVESRMEADCLLINRGLKTGLSIAILSPDLKSTTMHNKEAEILQSNIGFNGLKRLEIENDACLVMVKGWVKSYEAAYTAVSRIISIELGEFQLQTSRYP